MVEAEAITIAERASSLMMSPNHLEEDHPRRSAMEKQVLDAFYSWQVQAALVTAADLQLVRFCAYCQFKPHAPLLVQVP
jgi:hypothetical protein